jgi:hypothetical protein
MSSSSSIDARTAAKAASASSRGPASTGRSASGLVSRRPSSASTSRARYTDTGIPRTSAAWRNWRHMPASTAIRAAGYGLGKGATVPRVAPRCNCVGGRFRRVGSRRRRVLPTKVRQVACLHARIADDRCEPARPRSCDDDGTTASKLTLRRTVWTQRRGARAPGRGTREVEVPPTRWASAAPQGEAHSCVRFVLGTLSAPAAVPAALYRRCASLSPMQLGERLIHSLPLKAALGRLESERGEFLPSSVGRRAAVAAAIATSSL